MGELLVCYAFCMHQLFSKHPAFWRAFAGLLLGMILTYLCAELFFKTLYENPNPPLLSMLLVSPLAGMGLVVSLLPIPDVASFIIIIVGGIFPYPLAGAALFFLGGKRQTAKIVAWEVGIIVAFLGLGIAGFLQM